MFWVLKKDKARNKKKKNLSPNEMLYMWGLPDTDEFPLTF